MIPRIAREVALQRLMGDWHDLPRLLLRNCSAAVAMEISSPLTLICATPSTTTGTPVVV
jgi:hypothetical protein